jgi:ethanolamine utilization protein EutN
MILGKVTGTVVATAKHPAYQGMKLLLVRPWDPDRGLLEEEVVAVDRAQAGEGDTVLVLQEGNGVRQIWTGDVKARFPVLETVVGVVDDVEVGS